MLFDSSAFVAEPDLIQALLKRAFSVDCRNDGELFHQGGDPTGLYILQSGEATMILENARGVQVATVAMVPGALLGLPALVADEPYSMTAVAKAGAQVAFVTRNTLSVLMLSEPLLALKILRVLASEVRSARGAISKRRFSPSRKSAEAETFDAGD